MLMPHDYVSTIFTCYNNHFFDCCLLFPLIVLSVSWVSASEVEELIIEVAESISPLDLAEPGNTTFAEALQEILQADLGFSQADVQYLELQTAAAWIAAAQLDKAQVLLQAIDVSSSQPEIVERTGLLFIEYWQRRLDLAHPIEENPLAYLANRGVFSPAVQGRAWLIEAQRQLSEAQSAQAIAACDAALQLLKNDERARTPAYEWRIAAMEQRGDSSQVISLWLRQTDDNAALPIIVQRQQQQIVGRPMPALAGAIRGIPNDDKDDKADKAAEAQFNIAEYQGRPIIVYFFATWSEPCLAISPVIGELALRHPEWQVVAVSLDTVDTVAQIAPYRQTFAWNFPVLGQGIGWNGDWDEAWFIKAVPQAVLIDAQGLIAAVDVAGLSYQQMKQSIDDVLNTQQENQQENQPNEQHDHPAQPDRRLPVIPHQEAVP